MKKIVIMGLIGFTFICSCGPSIPLVTVTFPDGKDAVEIPFTRYRDWIIIKALVNNTKTLSFILDTGAPIAVLGNDDLAKGLNLHIVGNVRVRGSDESEPQSVPLAENVTFKIGGVEIKDALMAVGAAGNTIAGVDGVIGKYLFDHAVVRIDWEENRIIMTKPDRYAYDGKGETLPIQSAKSGHIYTEVTITKNGREKKINAIIDTGKRSALRIDQYAGSSVTNGEAKLSNIYIGRGANGPTYGDVTRTDVTLGPLHMSDVVTEIKGTPGVMEEGDLHGSIGLGLLDRFTLVFDYRNRRLMIEKNAHFSDTFMFNRSGIALAPFTAKEHLLIADIIPGSPAAENGVLKGDRIISVNGTNVPNLPLNTIDEVIRGMESDAIEVEIQRGGETVKKKLIMRQLI